MPSKVAIVALGPDQLHRKADFLRCHTLLLLASASPTLVLKNGSIAVGRISPSRGASLALSA